MDAKMMPELVKIGHSPLSGTKI